MIPAARVHVWMAEAAEERLSQQLQTELQKLEKDCIRPLLASCERFIINLEM